MEKGLYVKRFYGNSVQTARGHLALACSLAPSFKRKVFTTYPELNLRCLPDILQDAGWRTLFLMASTDLSFDQMGPFLSRNGFEVVQAMDATQVTPEQEKYVYGWGLQDDIFFGNAFRFLDEQHRKDEEAVAQGKAAGVKPYFVTLATISHHNPFGPLPEDSPVVFPEPQDFRERFINSLHLSDAYLGRFFTELECRPWLANSIVIITGDHSFPAGEHGTRFNHVGFHDDHFHVPFLLMWPGHIKPGVVDDVPFSQLDVAPTIMDLLGVRAENHFLGRSILGADREPAPIPLIQPYDGKYLSIVRGRYKYVRNLRTRREYLFDLESDPEERTNRHDDPALDGTLKQLRKDLGLLYLNQQLIEEDRVWPKK